MNFIKLFFGKLGFLSISNIKINFVFLLALFSLLFITATNLYSTQSFTQKNELLFYMPFDGDNKPLVAKGSSLPLYNSVAHDYVQGVKGKAAFYSRNTPKTNTKTAWLNYFLGSTFDSFNNIPLEESTFEVWIRPDREMLTYPYWKRYYLFSVGRAYGMQLYFAMEKNKLTLNYGEGRIGFSWPQGERKYESKDKKVKVNEKDFWEKWHHVALVYNRKERKVYLDGKEILKMKAFAASPILSSDLNVAWGGRLAPWTFCGAIDEFRIWNGCRYKQNFEPEIVDENIKYDKASYSYSGKRRSPAINLYQIETEPEKLSFLIKAGKEKYRLSFAMADGMPWLLYCKPGRQLGRERRDAKRIMSYLKFKDMIVDKKNGSIKAKLDKYNLELKLDLDTTGSNGKVKIFLNNNERQWDLLLQPQITVNKIGGKAWTKIFDGSGEHYITEPFNAISFAGSGMIFPLNAAWNNESGLAMAFAPEQFFSWIEQGMNAEKHMLSSWRTVISPRSSGKWDMELFSFDPRYSSDGAIARYHEKHPKFFNLSPNVDWRIYTGSANSISAFYNKKYWHPSKVEYFSGQEINRRAGAYWEWFYRSGNSSGDWAITDFFNDNSPNFSGLFGSRTSTEELQKQRRKSLEKLQSVGVSPNFYFLPWIERRYIKYFTASIINPLDVDNAYPYYDGWWRGGMRDYVVMPWGTRAGEFFKNSLKRIVKQYPEVDSFAFDVLEGNHKFRGRTSLNTERAYDESGIFVDFMLGYAKIAETVKQLKNSKNKQLSLAGNPHIWRSSFSALFRMDNIIHEGRYFEIINSDEQARHNSRFLGSKRISIYQHGYNDYVANYYMNSSEFSEKQAAAVNAVYHSQAFLRCFLNNMNPGAHLINGFQELEQGMLDHKRLMRYQYKFVSALSTSLPVKGARYGDHDGGIIALVNPSLSEQKSKLKIDCGYLGAVPLLGRVNAKESLELNGTSDEIKTTVKCSALGWVMLDLIASIELKGKEKITYNSSFTYSADRRTGKIKFISAPVKRVKLNIGLLPFEKVSKVTINGRKINSQMEIKLKDGDLLEIVIDDQRWLSSMQEIVNFPFIAKSPTIYYENQSIFNWAKRFKEYFRFWTANTAGQTKLLLNMRKTPVKDKPWAVIVSTKAPDKNLPAKGIMRKEKHLYIWAPKDELLRMVDEVLNALDNKYHSPGRFGYQSCTAGFDHAKTGAQKRLEVKIAGKSYSVKKLLPLFKSIPYPGNNKKQAKKTK